MEDFRDLVDEDGNELPYPNAIKKDSMTSEKIYELVDEDNNEMPTTTSQIEDLKNAREMLVGIDGNIMKDTKGNGMQKTLFNPNMRGFAGPLILGMITALAGAIFMFMVK